METPGKGQGIRDQCVRPGLLQQREGRWTVCLTCERRCRLVEGGTGWCRTRRNIAGTVHTLTYGWVSSRSANPIEKKPFYHVHPGTIALTAEALRLCVGAGLDAMNVDRKGRAGPVRRHCKGIEVEKVWATCRAARAAGVHLEVTTLVIPGVNDDETSLGEMAERILADLGEEAPWHLTRYFPAFRFTAPATPVATLERAASIGRGAGLRFVYIGNVPGHPSSNTACPECGMLLIQRQGFGVTQDRVQSGRCPDCGRGIAGVWNAPAGMRVPKDAPDGGAGGSWAREQ